MSDEISNHAESGIMDISSFRDPVDNPQIASTMTVSNIVEDQRNPLYGYYGYVRKRGAKSHWGFDYVTEEPPFNNEESGISGTNVFPIHEGEVVKIRIGRLFDHNKETISYYPLKQIVDQTNIKNNEGEQENATAKTIKLIDGKEIRITIQQDGTECIEVDGENRNIKEYKQEKYFELDKNYQCPFLKSIPNNHFYPNECEKCIGFFINSKGNMEKIRSYCFGIQVWLKIKKNNNILYAYYAHLSELSGEISSKLNEKYQENKNANTFDISYTFKSDELGNPIGKSGRTGNAWNKNEVPVPHLHFECRKGIETGTQIIPNHIVKTHFMAWERIDDDIMISIGGAEDEISQVEWYVFFDVKKIIDRIAERKKQKEERQKNNNSTKEIDDEIAQLEDALKKRWRKRREQIFIAEY